MYGCSEYFTVLSVSPLTNLDHSSPVVYYKYIIPQNYTPYNTFLTPNIFILNRIVLFKLRF
jgi:hypothetical protein